MKTKDAIQNELFDKYPYLLDGANCFLNGLPSGWTPIILEAAENINKVLKDNELDADRVWTAEMQENAKGRLRWYWAGTIKGLPPEVEDAIQDIVTETEERSTRVCMDCGAPATYTLTMMHYPLCDKCAKKIKYYNLVREL